MFVTQTFESWGEVSAHRKPASESQLGICHAQYSQAEVEFGFELQHIEGKLWDDDQKEVVFPSVPVEGGNCMEFNLSPRLLVVYMLSLYVFKYIFP